MDVGGFFWIMKWGFASLDGEECRKMCAGFVCLNLKCFMTP